MTKTDQLPRPVELSNAGFSDAHISGWMVIEAWRLHRLGFSPAEISHIVLRTDDPAYQHMREWVEGTLAAPLAGAEPLA